MEIVDNKPVLKRDSLAAVAFYLGVIIMIFPTEADYLYVFHREQDFVRATLFAIVCFAIVFTPFFLAWRRWRRQPNVWKSRGYLIATLIILVLNVLMIIVMFAGALQHRTNT